MQQAEQNIQLINNQKLFVGLQWEEQPGQEIDLDLQCCLIDEIGQIDDAVFYNQLKSKVANISLSEDSKGEKQGFDELLTIDLLSLPFQIKYIVLLVCSYKGQPFKCMESSNIQIFQENKNPQFVSLGSLGDEKSVVFSVLRKEQNGNWIQISTNECSKTGKTFIECEKEIKQAIIKAGFDEVLFQECKNWTGGKSFQMQKQSCLIIPQQIKEVFVGLGWDTSCDIDSSLLVFSNNGELLDNIYFGKKTNSNHSIVHQGDNLTGFGSGDDEVIKIHLDKLPSQIKSIWSAITIYTGGKQFDDVKGAYCRLVDSHSKKEFCKFNLSQNQDGISNGCIMCCITRYQNDMWGIQAKGFYTKDTSRSSQVEPIIRLLLQNNYSQIKQLAQQSVTIQKAIGLGAFDSNGLSDPYVKVYVQDKKFGQTKTIKKNLNPEWNEKFQIFYNLGQTIKFEIYDHDTLVSDDYMGSCFIQVDNNFLQRTSQQLTLKVHDKKGQQHEKCKGQLYVLIENY